MRPGWTLNSRNGIPRPAVLSLEMILDLLVVGIVVGASLLGARKGLAWQLAGILSLVVGFVVALPLSGPAAHFFGKTAPLNRFIAVAVIYAAVSLAIYLAAFFYRKAIQKWKLDNWDRHLGIFLGGVKGGLLCLSLTFFAITLFAGLREPILTTRSGKAMAYTMNALHPLWPPGTHAIIHPYIHHLEEPEEEPGEAKPPSPPSR